MTSDFIRTVDRLCPDSIERGRHQVWFLCLVMWMALTGAPASVEAQGLSQLRNSSRNLTRHSLEAIRTIIRPTLGIVQGRAGAVTGLHLNNDRSLLLVVLGDGSVRFWDLERGVQLGSAIGRTLVSGAFRGGGSDAVAVRREGSLVLVQADGTIRRLRESTGASPSPAPVVSGDGRSVVFHTADGDWYWMHVDSNSRQRLDDAGRDLRPILSHDGLKVAYHTNRGVWAVRSLDAHGAKGAEVELGTCVQDEVRALTGAFTPDGSRIVFGDEQGGFCTWLVSGPGSPKRLSARRAAYPGAIRLLAIGPDGKQVALGGHDATVAVWSVAPVRRRATLELTGERPRSLLLDTGRGWLFTGEDNGTVGIYSLRNKLRIARLVSMDRGWAVLDRAGRFDGSQNGFDSLVWAGEAEEDTRPLDAFSESYFEPGLLLRLDDASPVFLNENIRDLSEDGYVRPPKVSIDPVSAQAADQQGHLSLRVRVEPGYCCEVSEIRLYHNGKLVPADRAEASPGDMIDYLVQPLPGENSFDAIGVGPGGVDGPKASTTVMLDLPEPSAPSIQIVAVGINEYNGPLRKLRFSRNDAETILDTLHKRANTTFASVKAIKLLDSSANFHAIEEHIIETTLAPHDVLVVYLAGHGYALNKDGRWEWYFLPFTTAWGEHAGLDWEKEMKTMIPRHGLSSRQLLNFLTKTAPRRVFFILDSCRSGAVVDTMKHFGGQELTDSAGQKMLHKLGRVGGIHVLAATRADQDAVELISAPHGALTYLVLHGLEGAADENQDSRFSVRELIGYANRGMPLLSRQLVQDNISQNPVGYSHGEDFVLGKL